METLEASTSNAEISLPTLSSVEASVYFVVQDDSDLCFYRVPDRLPPEPNKKYEPGQQFLEPEFILKNQEVVHRGCAAVGSTIYVCGGGSYSSETGKKTMSKRLDFIDTSLGGIDEEGWKTGESMKLARTHHTCFSLNNKMYTLAGLDLHDYRKILPMEEYDPENNEWKTISGCASDCHDFAVYEQGNEVIVYPERKDKLLTFDAVKGTIEPRKYPPFLDYGLPVCIAILGHIIYMWVYTNDDDGHLELVGYDLKQNFSSPAVVTGVDKLMANWPNYRLPYYEFKMIPIGENKLAMVWKSRAPELVEFYVNCLKFEMNVETYPDQNKMSLTAHSGSFSSHRVRGLCINHCFPVYYHPKKEVNVDDTGGGADAQEVEGPVEKTNEIDEVGEGKTGEVPVTDEVGEGKTSEVPVTDEVGGEKTDEVAAVKTNENDVTDEVGQGKTGEGSVVKVDKVAGDKGGKKVAGGKGVKKKLAHLFSSSSRREK